MRTTRLSTRCSSSDGRFAKVGGVRDTGDDADVVNLRGRTVIPGIIDNHVHFIRIGNAAGYDERRLETAFTVARAAQSLIQARAKSAPEGEFVTALAGIARRQFRPEGRFPTLAELDDAAPRHPVLISETGAGQANTLGRDMLRSPGGDRQRRRLDEQPRPGLHRARCLPDH